MDQSAKSWGTHCHVDRPDKCSRGTDFWFSADLIAEWCMSYNYDYIGGWCMSYNYDYIGGWCMSYNYDYIGEWCMSYNYDYIGGWCMSYNYDYIGLRVVSSHHSSDIVFMIAISLLYVLVHVKCS